jgi:hypothetical protein
MASNVLKTLKTYFCYSRHDVHLKLQKETCRQDSLSIRTANEGPVRIQYKCLVPIYVQYTQK